MTLVLGLITSYFIGSIPTAYLVGKWVKGIDIREHGSGNVGATNVFRVVGKKWGIGVLLFDILKGLATVSLVPHYFPFEPLTQFVTALLFGVAAIGGHTWTVWLEFRGGKGVATSLGVLLGLVPLAAGSALFVWVVLFWWKRYVSLASLGMALSLPLWSVLFYSSAESFGILLVLSVVLAAFIFYTHRGNIQRLREGTEKRFL